MGVPDATPVTMPDEEPTVARATLLLLQVPPVVGSLRVVVCPTHTFVVPVIAPGAPFTVNGFVTIQPEGKV